MDVVLVNAWTFLIFTRANCFIISRPSVVLGLRRNTNFYPLFLTCLYVCCTCVCSCVNSWQPYSGYRFERIFVKFYQNVDRPLKWSAQVHYNCNTRKKFLYCGCIVVALHLCGPLYTRFVHGKNWALAQIGTEKNNFDNFSVLRRKPVTTDVSALIIFLLFLTYPIRVEQDWCVVSVPTGSPQNFTAIGVSSTSIRLQWDPPPRKHRNGDIVLYEVLYHQQRPSTVDWTTNTTDKSVMVEGLETSTDYNFMIRAYTAIGPGPWSNRLPFRTFPHRKRLLLSVCGCGCFTRITLAARVSCLKLRWWHTTVSMADHQCTSATSVHRSSLFPFVLGFALLTTMTSLYHVLGSRVMVRAVSASRHPRFATCCHLISRTVMLVANSSSRALRLGCLCKPTHKRRHWELCLSGALRILDLIDWLILWFARTSERFQ